MMITLNHIHRVIQRQDGDRIFVSAISDWQLNTYPNTWRPSVDVFELDDSLVIRMEIAGMKDEDIKVNFSESIITITGSRSDDSVKRAFHQMEIFFGEFKAEIDVTQPFQAEGAKAEYSDGFLQISLPKTISKNEEIKNADNRPELRQSIES
jgi:HSP20 family protein